MGIDPCTYRSEKLAGICSAGWLAGRAGLRQTSQSCRKKRSGRAKDKSNRVYYSKSNAVINANHFWRIPSHHDDSLSYTRTYSITAPTYRGRRFNRHYRITARTHTDSRAGEHTIFCLDTPIVSLLSSFTTTLPLNPSFPDRS